MSGTTIMYVPHCRSFFSPVKWSINPFVSGTRKRGLTSSSNCPPVCSTSWNTHIYILHDIQLCDNFRLYYIRTWKPVLPLFYPFAFVAVPVYWQGHGVVPWALWCHSRCLRPPQLPLPLMQREKTLPRVWHHLPVKQMQTIMRHFLPLVSTASGNFNSSVYINLI